MLYFTIEKRLQDGIGKVPEAAGARWRFYRRISSDYRRIIVGYPRIVFLLAEAIQGFSVDMLTSEFVAGALFGEVGGWLCLLCALEMTFHMCRRSLVTLILRGRRSIWWGWMLTVLAPRIGNDVSYVTQIIDDIHFAWQAQDLVKFESDFSWQAAALRDILGDSRSAKCYILQ